MMDMQERPMSFSSYQSMTTCGRKYYLSYVLGLASKKVSINLGFGKVVDMVCSNYLKGLCIGKVNDPLKSLDSTWETEIASKKSWNWGKRFTPDEFYYMAKAIAEQFPERWKKSNLIPLTSIDGEPLVQWRTHHKIAGISCHSVIDVICAHVDTGEIGPVDLKTTISPSPIDWIPHSEQLGFYKYAIESDPRVPYEHVSHGGFLEMTKSKPNFPGDGRVKKVIGPQVIPPKFCELDQHSLAELPSRIAITNERIKRKEFIAQPRMAFNTPCTLCDFADYCLKGDKSHLVKKSDIIAIQSI